MPKDLNGVDNPVQCGQLVKKKNYRIFGKQFITKLVVVILSVLSSDITGRGENMPTECRVLRLWR